MEENLIKMFVDEIHGILLQNIFASDENSAIEFVKKSINLNRDIDLSVFNNYYLRTALRKGFFNLAKLLIDSGCDINDAAKEVFSSIHGIGKNDSVYVVARLKALKFAIENGINIPERCDVFNELKISPDSEYLNGSEYRMTIISYINVVLVNTL